MLHIVRHCLSTGSLGSHHWHDAVKAQDAKATDSAKIGIAVAAPRAGYSSRCRFIARELPQRSGAVLHAPGSTVPAPEKARESYGDSY